MFWKIKIQTRRCLRLQFVILQADETNPEEFFASILDMNSHLDFGLIEKDLETIPSSSSDSGLSSALSLSESYEQQLSPFLSKTDNNDEEEIGNSNLNSPQDCMDFEPAASPSLGSVDSPVRSVMSSNIGSPTTDLVEEMDLDHSLVAIVAPNNIMPNLNTTTTIATEQSLGDIGRFLLYVQGHIWIYIWYVTICYIKCKVQETSLNNISLSWLPWCNFSFDNMFVSHKLRYT